MPELQLVERRRRIPQRDHVVQVVVREPVRRLVRVDRVQRAVDADAADLSSSVSHVAIMRCIVQGGDRRAQGRPMDGTYIEDDRLDDHGGRVDKSRWTWFRLLASL